MENAKKPKELWERLANESERAYRAFQYFLALPSGERTVAAAYKAYTGNPDAPKPSDTCTRWSGQFAWRERALAYDDFLASLRRGAFERAVKEEAERQGVMVERIRNQMNEMLTIGYERAMQKLEEVTPDEMRIQDVLQIVRLHFDLSKEFGHTEEPNGEEGWTEEDDREFAETILEIEEEAEADDPDEDREDSEETESG
jgi:hypothetical protein